MRMVLFVFAVACSKPPTPPAHDLAGDCTADELRTVTAYRGDNLLLGEGDSHVDPPNALSTGRITEPGEYAALQEYAGEALPEVDFSTHAVLLSMAASRETCGFSDTSVSVIDRSGEPVLLTHVIDPTALCEERCAQGQTHWAAVSVPLAVGGSACAVVTPSCVVTEE